MRNPNIAVAVMAVIIFGGGFIVRNSGEGAMQLVGLLALIIGFGTLFYLEERDDRRGKRPQ